MSWDLEVFRSKTQKYETFDPTDIEPIPQKTALDAICKEFPGTDISDPAWMVYDDDAVSVVFSFAEEQYISLSVSILEDECEMELLERIRRFSDSLGWRIFDCEQCEFLTTAQKLYPCPCCERLTLTEEPPGTHEICPACGWEDDPVQFDNPDYAGGANSLSLNEARTRIGKNGKSGLIKRLWTACCRRGKRFAGKKLK